MRKSVLLIPLMLLTCTPFSTRYDRIEPDKVRPITVVFDTHGMYPEGAPGDTVRARAYFAGDSATSVSWTVSWDVITNAYGTDTFLNVKQLQQFNLASDLPDSQVFNFTVPDSVFYTTQAISEQTLALVRPLLPSPMRSLSRADYASFLRDFASVNIASPASFNAFLAAWGPKLSSDTAGNLLDSAIAAAGVLVNTFSIKAYVFANISAKGGKRLVEKADFVVRYNSRVAQIPMVSALVPVNTNPRIRWLGMYLVKGGPNRSFSPNDSGFAGKWRLQYLYNELFPDSVHDTVLIDTGTSYYMAADSGMVQYTLHAGDTLHGVPLSRDTVINDTSIDKYYTVKKRCVTAKADTTMRFTLAFVPDSIHIPKDSSRCFSSDAYSFEIFYYDWFFENLALDSVTMPLDSLAVLSAGYSSNSFTQMLPSLDAHMTLAHFWVVTYDYYLGQYNRPEGQCFREVFCHFTYSDAYKSAKAR
jgi:hypothetical protein